MKLLKATILLLGILFSIYTDAQTITIGSGTATNGYNEASPVNITRDRSVSWTVYTVAELNAAGFTGAGTINRMGYFVTNIPVNNIPGYTISIKHTNAANAGSNPGNNGFTEVKSAFTYAPNQGDWDMLDLDTPFNWNGTQNICVKVCWSTANNDPSGQLRTYAATNGYRYRWTNNGNGSYCGANPNTNRQWKPQIRFVFETETIWSGAAGTDWFNASNWSAGIPDATMDARIPVGATNDPILTGTANVANFTLEGAMVIEATGTLNVNGDFINSGTYSDNGGSTVLTGAGPNTINNSTSLNISTLIVESKLGGQATGSLITITKELQVNKSAFNTNDLITLRSDASGTARIAELTTNCFFQLDMFDAWGDGWNGGALSVYEDGVLLNIYQAFGSATTEILPIANGSVMTLEYSSGIFENENTYDLYDPSGTLIFSDGPNPATGTVFTTTASCGFTQDPISGDVNAERYIDAGETYWRYFGSAVQGADLEQFDDDFVTAGYPGSHFPGFGWISAYNYNETQGPGLGYNGPSSSAQIMQPGEGWLIWCGDTSTGTQPFTFDLTGVPNQGDVNLPVTYTNTGTAAEDGFNLVANPYASTIDWDDNDWVKTNMADAVYIQNPDNQQYATYIAGASTNGGSRYIASQQSFWVQSFAASPVLTAREGVKSNVDQAFIKNAEIYNPGMTIRLQGDEDFDEVVLRHIEGSDDQFEYAYDANKFWGGWGEYPQLSVINGEQKDLTVHSFDKMNQEWQIPLRAIVFQNGSYNIEFEHTGELDVPCMKLEDTYTGMMYPIEEGVQYTFNMTDTTYDARFVIHIGRDYNMTTTNTTCFGDEDGQIELELDEVSVDFDVVHNGQTNTFSQSGNPLQLTDLSPGIYEINVSGVINLCGQNTFSAVVNEPVQLQANPTVTNETYGGDGYIVLDVIGGTQPYDYMWSTAAQGNAAYSLYPGEYSVLITDANGCELEESWMIGSVLSLGDDSENVFAFYDHTSNSIQISGLILGDSYSFILYGMSGQIIDRFEIQNAGEKIQLEMKGNLSEGIYILKGNILAFKFKK